MPARLTSSGSTCARPASSARPGRPRSSETAARVLAPRARAGERRVASTTAQGVVQDGVGHVRACRPPRACPEVLGAARTAGRPGSGRRAGRAAPDARWRGVAAQLQRDGEAVELPLGQRVGAVLVERVLGRDDDERVGQRVPHAVDGHRALVHRLEERRLGARRSAVELVDEEHRREDRAGHEGERRRAPGPTCRCRSHPRAAGRRWPGCAASRRRARRPARGRASSSRCRAGPRAGRARPRGRRARRSPPGRAGRAPPSRWPRPGHGLGRSRPAGGPPRRAPTPAPTWSPIRRRPDPGRLERPFDLTAGCSGRSVNDSVEIRTPSISSRRRRTSPRPR